MAESKIWTVTLKALAGPDPLSGGNLTATEETLTVRAVDRLEAKEMGLLHHSMKLRGHELEVWINGRRYFDPRF